MAVRIGTWWRLHAAAIALVVISVALLQLAGITSATDAALRRDYYLVRGPRASGSRVLLVRVSERQRLQATLAPILADGPRAVAILDAPAWSAIDPEGADIARGGGPPSTEIEGFARDPRVLVWRGESALFEAEAAGMDILPLRDLRSERTRTFAAAVLDRAGIARTGDDALPVNYLGRAVHVPGLSDVAIIAGGIPSGTFHDRIVVVAASEDPTVQTPIGLLSSTEVFAQGVLGASDGVAWNSVSGWARTILVACIAALSVFLLRRRGELRTAATAIALVSLIVLVDFALFAGGAWLLGASAPIAAVAFSFAAAWLLDSRDRRHEVSSLLRMIPADVQQRRREAALDDALWARLVRIGELHVGAQRSALADLPAGGSHLRLRAVSTGNVADLAVHETDIRREPFRSAFASRRATPLGTSPGSDAGLQAWMVPLVIDGRARGAWILNFPIDSPPDATQIALIERLASEIASEIERSDHARGDLGRVREFTVVAEQLEAVLEDRCRRGSVLQGAPVPILTATLWGEVDFINPAMLSCLARDGIETPQGLGLIDLLATLTGESAETIRSIVRHVVPEHASIPLVSRASSSPDVSRETYLLSCVQPVRDICSAGTRIVLTRSSAPSSRSVSSTTVAPSPSAQGPSGDVRTILLAWLRRRRAANVADPQRAVSLHTVDPLPRCRGDAASLSEALQCILGDLERHTPRAATPIAIAANHSHGQIVLRIEDPEALIPASAMQRLFDDDKARDGKGTLARARDLVRANGGEILPERLESGGLAFHVRLPAEA